jgi:hypothetical protein
VAQDSIFLPVIALATLTFTVLGLVPLRRFRAAFARQVDGLTLGIAWAFVAIRAAHSLVHLTYNKVFHRLALFAISNVVLLALWVVFAVRVWPAAS